MPAKQRLWPAIAREMLAEIRRPVALLAWLLGLGLVALVPQFETATPAPFNLDVGSLQTVVALCVGLFAGAVQMAAARQRGSVRFAAMLVSRFLLTGLALFAAHKLARGFGMPPLSHPASTTLALIATAFCMACLGLFTGSRVRSVGVAIFMGVQLVIVLLFTMFFLYLPLSPASWSRLAVQTAVTGTGTRAAASALLALVGLGLATLIAGRSSAPRWPVAVAVASWLGLAALATLRPGPPLPLGDMDAIDLAAPLPSDRGHIAPIATTAPDAALESGLARIKRQIAIWPAAAVPDTVQRARNLLLIAAVPDLYDSEPLQSHLPLLVEAEIAARVPAAELETALRTIAADPAGGSVAARATLPSLGIAASAGDEARVRERVSLYAAKLLKRRGAAEVP